MRMLDYYLRLAFILIFIWIWGHVLFSVWPAVAVATGVLIAIGIILSLIDMKGTGL